MKTTHKHKISKLPTNKHPSVEAKHKISKLPTNKHPSVEAKHKISKLPTNKHPSVEAKHNEDNLRNFVHLCGKGLLLGVFVGLTIYGIFYAWSWSISTTRAQSETFTELYFEDYLHLPYKVISRHPYFFQFTLHNLEGKDMDYSYEVYIKLGKVELIFDKGMIFVKEGDYETIQERFASASVLPKSEIVVYLKNKNQQIDFWIEGSG